MGPFEKKIERAYCLEHYSKQIPFNNAFEKPCRFKARSRRAFKQNKSVQIEDRSSHVEGYVYLV